MRLYSETEAEIHGDRGGDTRRQRRRYTETEAEIHGDRDGKHIYSVWI
jgi:hypothetical protein